MTARVKSPAILLAALLLALAFALGCASGEQTGKSESERTAAPIPTPTPEPTVVPALLMLGEGGVLEDDHVRLRIPEYLEYDSSPAYNCAYYTFVSDGGVSLAFAYVPDPDTSYQKEIGGMKREDYAKQVFNSSGANLEEFKFVKVQGHDALRTLTVYQGSNGVKSRMLTYFIDVDGWLLTLSYTTNAASLPEECEQGILDIELKTDLG